MKISTGGGSMGWKVEDKNQISNNSLLSTGSSGFHLSILVSTFQFLVLPPQDTNGTFFWGAWSSCPTRDTVTLAALDRLPSGRIADFFSQAQRLTQIPGVMWDVALLSEPVTEWGPPRIRIGTAGSGCPCCAGDQPESGIPGLHHPALHGSPRPDFKFSLVGLGKDAGVTA